VIITNFDATVTALQSVLSFTHSLLRMSSGKLGIFNHKYLIQTQTMDRQLQNEAEALTPKMLLSILECPVCLEYSIGLKIFVCGNGHSVCENCQPDLSECPTCQGPPAKTRNLGLEQLAENVVVECPFAENGCTSFLSSSDYQIHKTACDFG
jgi:hypothetical protein